MKISRRRFLTTLLGGAIGLSPLGRFFMALAGGDSPPVSAAPQSEAAIGESGGFLVPAPYAEMLLATLSSKHITTYQATIPLESSRGIYPGEIRNQWLDADSEPLCFEQWPSHFFNDQVKAGRIGGPILVEESDVSWES